MSTQKYVVKYEEITDPEKIYSFLNGLPKEVKCPTVLIGSRALNHWCPEYREKEFLDSNFRQKDFDLIMDVSTAVGLFPIPSQFKWYSGYYGSQASYRDNNANKTGPAGFYGATLTIIHTTKDGKNDRYKLLVSCQDGSMDIELVTNTHQSGFDIATESKDSVSISRKLYEKRDDRNNTVPNTINMRIAPLEILEVIKTSHIYHPHNFTKHIEDLHFIRKELKKLPPYIRNEYLIIIRKLEIDLIKGTPGQKINLNMSNDDFLEKEGTLLVEKMIKHDDIHDLVKFGEKPMYTRIKIDQTKARCLKSLFDALTYTEQCQCVMEEAMVLALERYLLPEYETNEDKAYSYALTRVCTSITKGWFRSFAVDNWPAVNKCPKPIKEFARDVISKYETSQDKGVHNTIVPAGSFEPYFTKEELPIAILLVSHIEEIIESKETREEDSYSDDSEDESDEDEKNPVVSGTPIPSWVNNGRKRHTQVDLAGYDPDGYNDYQHNVSSYDFPHTIRVFKLHTSDHSPEMFIRVETHHSFTVQDCSESIAWGATITLGSPGKTRKESLYNINQSSWSLGYEKLPPHLLELEIVAKSSKGGSDANDTSVVSSVKGDTGYRFILRVILATLNPHMLPAGEGMLKKALAKLPDPIRENSRYLKKYTNAKNPGEHTLIKHHPWFIAYLCKNIRVDV